MRRIFLCLLVVAGVAACGSQTPSADDSPGIVPGPAFSSSPAAGLPLILTRTGGIAGVQDQIKIDPDGTAEVTRRAGAATKAALSAADLARLQGLLADPALAREATASRPAGVCADGFHYQLRTPSLSLTAEDCGASAKPTLTKVLDLLRPLLNA